jgi:1A family penicillin-binding protein
MSKKLFKLEPRDLITALLGFLIIIILVPILTYLYFARDLTSKEGVMNRNNTGVTLTDINNKPFFTFYQARTFDLIPLNQIPQTIQQAVISIEDKDFYIHPGFSLKAIARSIFLDVSKQELAYGGSTITQQLVKNSLLTPKKSFLRKYQELILAQELERRYSKQEILEMYLNSAYFGEGAFGISEATKRYFNKSITDLTLAESAFLAGLLQSPSNYSPFSGDEEAAKDRQAIVLQKMVEQGYVTVHQKDEALNEDLRFSQKADDLNQTAPHFALMVKSELEKKYGEERISRSGFVVKTTLNLDWQKYAEEVVTDQVTKLKGNRVTNGAAVVLDPKNGEIRALVGSANWYNEQFGRFNIPTGARPPGSSFKPIVYAQALEKKIITPSTVLKDQPITYRVQGSPDYKPKNYDNKFRGPVLPRRALANSLNVPAVEVMNKVGVKPTLEYVKKFGITTLGDNPRNFGLSLVLGPGNVSLLELTQAYGVFATGGLRPDNEIISEIKDKNGKVISVHKPGFEKVLDEGVAYQIASFLSDKNTRAEVFGTALNISRVAAVKTGTTEDYKDALTLGFTPSLVVGVWVGNNDNTPMDQIAGSLGAAPIWKALMEKFLEGTPVEEFNPPANLVKLNICKNNGFLLKGNVATTSALMEYYLPGTEPKQTCSFQIINPSPSPSTNQDSPPPSDQPSPEPQPSSPEPTPIIIEIPQGGQNFRIEIQSDDNGSDNRDKKDKND